MNVVQEIISKTKAQLTLFFGLLLNHSLSHFLLIVKELNFFQRTGIKKIMYVVEGDPNACEGADSIKTA